MKLKITQIKSRIRQNPKQKKVLDALGLRGIRKAVIQEDTPAIQGMLKLVDHLVLVEKQS